MSISSLLKNGPRVEREGTKLRREEWKQQQHPLVKTIGIIMPADCDWMSKGIAL